VLDDRAFATKVPASSLSEQKLPSVHANTSIIMAEVIILKPCGIQSANSVKLIIFLGIYNKNVNISVTNVPSTKPVEASQVANASTKGTPSKNPPV